MRNRREKMVEKSTKWFNYLGGDAFFTLQTSFVFHHGTKKLDNRSYFNIFLKTSWQSLGPIKCWKRRMDKCHLCGQSTKIFAFSYNELIVVLIKMINWIFILCAQRIASDEEEWIRFFVESEHIDCFAF